MTDAVSLSEGCDSMKIEKVNDHQIRCTLTKADLADRELKISELAYGTEKAKNLFRDMMQQASFECGFEAEDIPLMIEAIPLNSECIVLIITKVEDPEELDTRFSKFAPSVHDAEEESNEENMEHLAEGADDVLDLFKKIHEGKFRETYESEMEKAANASASLSDFVAESESASQAGSLDLTKVFSFTSLNELTRLAHVLKNYYAGVNSLYKNADSNRYILILSKSDHTPEEFNKICNIISEYGFSEKHTSATEAYLEEHCEIIITQKAMQSLALI